LGQTSPMTYTHGHIIPLVGGSVLGTTKALGNRPEWIASWSSAFATNDAYCLKYFNDVPFLDFTLDQLPVKYVDIITSLPPCAGLSLANQSTGKNEKSKNPRGCMAPSNLHMHNAALYSVKYLKPKAIMVENAPGLFTRMGEEFAERLNAVAFEHGYTMSLVKTSSIYHGLPQERTRSFFFLWKGDKVPVLNHIKKPYKQYHQFLKEGTFAKTDQVNIDTTLPPSQNHIWKYIRTKFDGYSQERILQEVASDRMTTIVRVVKDNNWFDDAIDTISDPKTNKFLRHAKYKFETDSCILDKSIKLAWDHTRSLMWQTLPYLLHPYEDRWLMTSEAFALMGFPSDFAEKVQMPTKDINIICQNVPATTAHDWMAEVAAALDGNRQWIDPETKEDGSNKILRQNNISRENQMVPIWDIK
jgi:site-specific DNA-cytosine methylase